LPEDLREWVSTGTLISWLEEHVEELGLRHPSLHQSPLAQGTPSPKALLRILVFACGTGVLDDQEVARLCHSDVAYRLLSDGTHPWPNELAGFRRKHRDLLVQALEELSLRSLQSRYAPNEIDFGKPLTDQLRNRAMDLVNTSCHLGSCDD